MGVQFEDALSWLVERAPAPPHDAVGARIYWRALLLAAAFQTMSDPPGEGSVLELPNSLAQWEQWMDDRLRDVPPVTMALLIMHANATPAERDAVNAQYDRISAYIFGSAPSFTSDVARPAWRSAN